MDERAPPGAHVCGVVLGVHRCPSSIPSLRSPEGGDRFRHRLAEGPAQPRTNYSTGVHQRCHVPAATRVSHAPLVRSGGLDLCAGGAWRGAPQLAAAVTARARAGRRRRQDLSIALSGYSTGSLARSRHNDAVGSGSRWRRIGAYLGVVWPSAEQHPTLRRREISRYGRWANPQLDRDIDEMRDRLKRLESDETRPPRDELP